MNTKIIAPESGDGSANCKIIKWNFPDGANVEVGDHVVTLETSYAFNEIEADVSGILRHQSLVGVTVEFGDVIGLIEGV